MKEFDIASEGVINSDVPLRVAFLGGGSFGTAMANLAARHGANTVLWLRDAAAVEDVNVRHRNSKYLKDYSLDRSLTATSDLKAAVTQKDIIFVAVPSHSFRGVLRDIRPFITAQAVVSLTKGVEPETFALMSDIIQQELPEVAYGVLSGPNLAKEILQYKPAGTVIASGSEALRLAVHRVFAGGGFRVFGNTDIQGVELGGALKNIYAVAMGMAAAYSMGENAKALLLTRALAEMTRFASAVGANPLTFLGLSGVGDLIATCSSPMSRNFQIGLALGKGATLERAVKELGQTAEGLNTIKQVHIMAQQKEIYMPITQALHRIIYEGADVISTVTQMMNATPVRSDVEYVLPN